MSNKPANIIKSEDIHKLTKLQLIALCEQKDLQLIEADRRVQVTQRRIYAQKHMDMLGEQIVSTLRITPFNEWPLLCQIADKEVESKAAFSTYSKQCFHESLPKE